MAQDYDKIFREVLKDIFPAVAQKVLGIPPDAYKPRGSGCMETPFAHSRLRAVGYLRRQQLELPLEAGAYVAAVLEQQFSEAL